MCGTHIIQSKLIKFLKDHCIKYARIRVFKKGTPIYQVSQLRSSLFQNLRFCPYMREYWSAKPVLSHTMCGGVFEQSTSDAYSELCQTSKMERFAKNIKD